MFHPVDLSGGDLILQTQGKENSRIGAALYEQGNVPLAFFHFAEQLLKAGNRLVVDRDNDVAGPNATRFGRIWLGRDQGFPTGTAVALYGFTGGGGDPGGANSDDS